MLCYKSFISFLPSKIIFLSNFGFSHKNSAYTKTMMESIWIYDDRIEYNYFIT